MKNIKDITGKIIEVGDILQDNVPSKGIVKLMDGKLIVSSDYEGRDIQSFEEADELDEFLIKDNAMYVIGNIDDNPELLERS